MLRSRLFLLLYVLSGAAALLYEVIWLRLLTLSMGHTSGAVGTILAAFMGGLAIGAWRGGLVASSLRPGRALQVYATLEVAVATCALLLPRALASLQPILASAYADGRGGALFDAVRLIVSLVLIAIPTAAMGASFPIGLRCLEDGDRDSAIGDPAVGIRDSGVGTRSAGALYAANTVGAAAGAALTGFVLLPALGLFGTTMVGVALNVSSAIGALILSKSTSLSPAPSHPSHLSHPSDAPSHPSHPSHLSSAALVLFVSGFVALVYEVAWTRILAMILGPTTYAFSAMLVAFIAGLAIGSAVAAAAVPNLRRPGVWLGAAVMAAAAAALIASARVDRLPLTIAAAAGRSDVDFGSIFALQVGLAIAIQLPMTIALGAMFPFAIALAAPSRPQMSRNAAIVYAANTAGAIAGALTASFILIPRVGLQTSVQLASLTAVATGLLVAWRSLSPVSLPPTRASLTEAARRRRTGAGLHRGRSGALLAAAAVVALAFLTPQWNHERLANGAYRFAPSLAAGDIETGLEAGDLAYYREGSAGTVSVKRLLGVTSLAIDGKVDASNGADMLTQKLLAHLPLLLHDRPRTVYVIGLGSGVTLGSALQHPIERAIVSEISPEVVAASNEFAKDNHNALNDRRSRLIVGDGRSHLLLSDERYDVIISEPSNPWMAGVSTLFTREFFMAARSRLAPDGILCQWAHTYNISDADLRSIVATFLSAFPDGSAWLVGEGDLLLIGSTAPVRALDEGIARAWSRPGVARDLAGAGVRDPFSLLTMFVGRGRDLAQYADGATVQSDDHLSLEFSAPRAVYGRFEQDNVKRLRQVAAGAERPPAVTRARATATATEWRNRAQMELAADSPDLAYQDFLEALSKAPDDVEALDGFARAAAAGGRLGDAEAYLRQRASSDARATVLTELSTVLAARGQMEEAAITAQRAAVLDPTNPRILQQLISALADSGNQTALEQLSGLLKQSAPDSVLALRCEMRLAYLRTDFSRAAQLGERLVSMTTAEADRARTLNLLGSAYASTGNHERARRAFEASLAIAPRDSAVLVNLGLTELRSGNARAAEERFSQALFLYPTLRPALDGLSQALDLQGKSARAAAIRAVLDKR